MADNSDLIILKTITEVRKWHQMIHGSIGFIPTMGFLHEGHASLIELAAKENDYVVVSIFVNPKQFGSEKDLNTYPKDEKNDLSLLKKAHATVAFLPDAEEMYPEEFETIVTVANLSKKLEGKSRPGHFDGVTTVVSKLFNIVQPTRAYFGQKDAQQVLIIKKMVKDLEFPIEIVVGETIREKDGLALSSRNTFLSEKEKIESEAISKSLALAHNLVKQGERDAEVIKKHMQEIIEKTSGKIDYISIADPYNLDELSVIQKKALVSLAVYYGNTRLVDNSFLTV